VQRREFFKSAVPFTGAAAIFGANPLASALDTKPQPNNELIEKIKLAMLSMQRSAWEQGVGSHALLELGDMDCMVLMAKDAVVRQNTDGRLGMDGDGDEVADPASLGEPVLEAGKITGDPAFKRASDKMLDYLLHRAPRASDGIISGVKSGIQLWSDSMYMVPPFLAIAGHPDEAIRQMEGHRKALWNQKAGLLAHIWDDGKKVWVDPGCWGVGNGWAAAGMAGVIKALPPSMKTEKQRLAGNVQEILDSCLVHQRPDGLFHNMVDRPDTFVETNLAQMLAYTVYRGTRAGWLDKRYLAAANRMRAAARAKVDNYGLVQGVCGSPHFDHPGTAAEGQAFFLLMEAAYRDSTN
jgi:rhamnogalacturonyl hydrolase YesR